MYSFGSRSKFVLGSVKLPLILKNIYSFLYCNNGSSGTVQGSAYDEWYHESSAVPWSERFEI